MDFKEIKNINVNSQKIDKKKPEVKKGKNQPEKKSDLKETPTNPSYWQSTVGIKKHNVSFGNSDTEQNQFIDSQIKNIRSSFHWKLDNTEGLETHRNVMY